MGINSFFTYTICLGAGVPWQQALGMVFVNGCIFLALSLSGVRERIIGAIPYSLKLAITCGIGLFIAFVGLRNGGIVVDSEATFVTHGDFTSGATALCLAGLALTIVLVARRVPAAIVLGMAITTAIGLVVPNGTGGTVTAWPAALMSAPASPAPVLLQLDLSFMTSGPAFFKALPLVLTLLLVDMFDNIGTLIGVAKRAGLLEADGTLPRAGRVLVADSRGRDPQRAPRHVHRRELHRIGVGRGGWGTHGAHYADDRGVLPAGAVSHAALPRGAGRGHRAGAGGGRHLHDAVGHRDRSVRLRDGGARQC